MKNDNMEKYCECTKDSPYDRKEKTVWKPFDAEEFFSGDSFDPSDCDYSRYIECTECGKTKIKCTKCGNYYENMCRYDFKKCNICWGSEYEH